MNKIKKIVIKKGATYRVIFLTPGLSVSYPPIAGGIFLLVKNGMA